MHDLLPEQVAFPDDAAVASRTNIALMTKRGRAAGSVKDVVQYHGSCPTLNLVCVRWCSRGGMEKCTVQEAKALGSEMGLSNFKILFQVRVGGGLGCWGFR